MTVLLVPHSTSTFQLRLWSSQGAAIPVQPDAFELTHGITVGAPPLPHSLGVGLENGQVRRVIEKDARLPARGTIHGLTLAKTVEAGSRSRAVFPICEGESDHSGRNIAIGWFEIRGSELARTLFAGTNLDVTFEADEDGLLRITVNADVLSEPKVVEYHARYPKLDREERQRQKHRLAHAGATFSRLKGAAAELGEPSPELEAISQDHMLEQAETSLNACGGKSITPGATDDLMKAHDLLCEVEEMQYRLEQRIELPRLKAEACWIINAARVIAETKGTTQDQQYVTSVVEQLETAMKHEDRSEARRQMRQLEQKRHELLRNDLEYLQSILAWFAANLGSLKDPMLAQDILSQADEAVKTGNVEVVQTAIGELVTLLPPEQSEGGIAGLISHLRSSGDIELN
jgi:molecular chaperone DnaK